ncbi:hypothetical protein PTKIN_Ptkin16aG0514800 [Pterospermum kingtungense]
MDGNPENVDDNMEVHTPGNGGLPEFHQIWANLMRNWQRQRILAVVHFYILRSSTE